MTAVHVISVPDIWSVLAPGVGGLLRVLFFLFHNGRRFRSTAADLIILSQRGIRDEARVVCFALDYLTFSVEEADLLKSWSSLLGSACLEKKAKLW